MPFTLYTKPDYEVNWHHQIISATLDRFLAGEIKRLMLFVPPRMGKTELASRRMPALVFGRNPDAAVMACSYNASYAAEVNRDVQRIMDSAEYRRLYPEAQLFGTNVRSNAKGTWLRNSDAFEIVGRKGVYRSAGIGVGIAGRGFEWGIIDDPVKGRADADSQAHRNHVWNWYLGDFFTRRADDSAAILLILTRWHQDDLAGRLLDQARQNPKLPQWTVVRFPALCEEEEKHPEDIRQPGQALWPARFDEAALEETRDTSGPREWAAVYQQRPSPASGTVFRQETFRYFTVEEQDGEPRVVLMDHRTG